MSVPVSIRRLRCVKAESGSAFFTPRVIICNQSVIIDKLCIVPYIFSLKKYHLNRIQGKGVGIQVFKLSYSTPHPEDSSNSKIAKSSRSPALIQTLQTSRCVILTCMYIKRIVSIYSRKGVNILFSRYG